MRKIWMITGLLLITLLTLSGCNKTSEEYYVNTSFLVESFNDENQYDEVKNDTFLLEKKEDFNIDTIISQFMTELKNENFVYNTSKTEIIEDDENHHIYIKAYFNLKEFNVTIKKGDEILTYPDTFKYMHILDLNKLNEFVGNQANSLWFDLDEKIIVNDNLLVNKNLNLTLIDGHQIESELAYLVSETKLLFDNLLSDDTLKLPENYSFNLQVVTTQTYNSLRKSYNEALKVFNKDELSRSVEEIYVDLFVIFERVQNEIITGTKIDNNFEVQSNYYDLVNKINQVILSFEGKIADLLIIEKDDNLANYYTHNQLIERVNYYRYQDVITNAKRTLINDVLTEDIDENILIVNKLRTTLLDLELQESKLKEDILVGSTPSLLKEYSVKVYYETTDGYPLVADEIITFEGIQGNNVSYKPEPKDGFYISSESILLGQLGDEEVVLTVKYERKRIVLAIDLDGGFNNSYDLNYIEVFYGEKIDDDVLNKLLNVTKEADIYHDTYTFDQYVDINGDLVDLTSPVTKAILIKASYLTSKHLVNYEIHTYQDVPMGSTEEPLYPQTPIITTSAEVVETGELLIYTPVIPAGFELDVENSVLIYSKLGRDDIIKVYLKRQILPIQFDFDGGILNDSRIVGNRTNIKYGQIFDFVVSGIDKESSQPNKFEIFDYLIDTNTNTTYELGQPVTTPLNLKVAYRFVSQRNVITADYSYLGASYMDGDTEVALSRKTYIGYNERITDPAFFLPDTYTEKAIFDPINNIGLIKDYGNNNYTMTYSYPGQAGASQTNYRLKFIYNTTTTQAENIMLNEHFRDVLLANTEREVVGTVKGKSGNLYLMEDEDGINFLAFVERGTDPSRIIPLQIGNKVRISGPFVKNYNDFINVNSNHLVGRFYEMTLKISNSSTVRTVINSPSSTTTIDIDVLTADKSLELINIDELLVLDVNNYQSSTVDGYDDGLNIDRYFSYKVMDKFGNIGYLHMADNNDVVGLKLFKELQVGHIVNIRSTAMINSRVNGDGIIGLYNSKYQPYPGLFIDNFTTQVEVVSRGTYINVNYEFLEPTETYFPLFDPIYKQLPIINGTKLESILEAHIKNEIYNGYHLSDVRVDGVSVDPSEYEITENESITLIFEQDTNYFEFYLGTLISDEIGNDLTITVTRGGQTYETSWVDRDENFYKFIISHNNLDPYIKISANFGSSSADNYLIISDYDSSDPIVKYVSYEAKIYNHINKEFGSQTNHFYELSWGSFTAEKWSDGTKGLFMHAFTTETEDSSDDSMFADSSLYSIILTENRNTVTNDGDRNINKDHNMQYKLYNYYEGAHFYMLDGSMSEEEINQSTNISIRSYQLFPLLDKRPNGEVYETEHTVKYYYSKDSITKFAKFNKFGLGIVFIDLNPNVWVEGVYYERPNKERHSIPYGLQDSKLGPEKDNSRILSTKEEFFQYMEDHQLPLYTNTDGTKSKQYYARLKADLNFKILNSDATFANNSDTLTLTKRYGEEIRIDELEISNLAGRDMIFINRNTGEAVDFKYRFDDEYMTDFDIILLTPTEVKIRMYSGEVDNIGLAQTLYNNYQVINHSVNVLPTGYSLFAKEFTVKLYRSNEFINPKLVNKFVFNYDNKNLEGINSEFVIPFNGDLDFKYFHVFDKSSVVIPAKTNQGTLILVTDDSLNTNPSLADYKLRIVDGSNNYEVTTKHQVYPRTVALLAEMTNISNVDIFLMKGNSGFSSSFAALLRNNQMLPRAFVTSNNGIQTFTNHLQDFENKLTIRYSTGWLENNFEQIVTRRKLSANDPLFINPNIFEDINGYEKLFAIKEGGKYIALDITKPLTNSNLSSIDIKVFYKPIYNPGEFVTVAFNLGQYGEVVGLEEVLYNGYLYLEVGKSLVLPNELTIKEGYQDTISFIGFTLNGQAFDLSIGISSGLHNITLVANYQSV